jgi:hypothetical protein
LIIEEDEEKKKAPKSEPKSQNEGNNSGIQEEKKNETSGMEGAEEAKQLEVEGPEKGLTEEIQHKEVDPLRDARRYPLPAVVKFSEGEEEMMDVGAVPKRGRGRSWKPDKTDHPLDPHKGSVADSGEGVCVDPGEKGAILETGGFGPSEMGKGQQLAPDSGGEGT